ncbi:hypothetical protein IU500_24725 [Nocardia terpenica]|uniref:hypothetical protein n=1 Tax=Nocardia terpenica TaxID=455432 RepID=UPI001895216B|nr:hypothetical protein [Nocardia terpenica]MBF6064707.1 hypothetical protein [Nocardia terpenica]MBF6107222.1 hypothetical protein [Nocardia terpenica]MBF6122085.1 hypothetical protein [Nocardia terpenica]
MSLYWVGLAAGVAACFDTVVAVWIAANCGLGDEDEADVAVRNRFAQRHLSEARTMPLPRVSDLSALDLLALQQATTLREPYPVTAKRSRG